MSSRGPFSAAYKLNDEIFAAGSTQRGPRTRRVAFHKLKASTHKNISFHRDEPPVDHPEAEDLRPVQTDHEVSFVNIKNDRGF